MENYKEVILKAQQGDESSKDILVKNNLSLVWSLVHRFNSSVVEKEELGVNTKLLNAGNVLNVCGNIPKLKF